jgi:hypothetical protein
MDKFKQLRALSVLLVLCSMTVGFLSAQSPIPTEHLKIKSGDFILSNFAGLSDQPFEILRQPEAEIGTASLSISGTNLIEFRFDSDEGASGMTEVIISYFQNIQPTYPVTKKFVIEVAQSCVKASNDYFSVYTNSILNILPVLNNDASDTTSLHIEKLVAINNGTAVIAPDGQTFEFTPDSDFLGQAYMTYLSCNDLGKCDVAEVAIQVVEEGSDLGHEKIFLRSFGGKEVQLTLPGPDFILGYGPSYGVLQGNDGDVAWKYTPQPGFAGVDTIHFEYNPQISRTFIVDISNMAMNYHAVNDFTYTRPNIEISLNVLENDLLVFPIDSYTEPSNGSVSDLGNGEFSYTPAFNFKGIDQFTYTTCYNDSVHCETATVAIHVGNLEPQNDFVYRFKTLKNTDLPVIYKIPFRDYVNTFSTNPEHGDLPYIPGDFSWIVECNDVEAFNLFIYVPDEDFVGHDYFEFYHCDPNTNLCSFVRVEVEVIDEEMDCPCVGPDCVWPGDINNDGVVDMEDLLTLGWYLGEHGPARSPSPISTWYGENGENWMLDQPFTDQNIKHADADGDGTITSADTLSISENYFQKNALIPVQQNLKVPYQFSLVPVSFSLDSGDLIILDVYIGTEEHPAENIHGLKFSLNIPPIILDSSSLRVDFHHDGWIGENSSTLSMDEVPYDGRIDAGFTRSRGNVLTGYGLIATLSFIVEDDIEGIRSDSDQIPFVIQLDRGVAYNGLGERVDIPGDSYTYILDLSKEDQPYDLEKSTLLFPNPTSDVLNIHVNGKNSINQVELFSFTGQQLSSHFDIGQNEYAVAVDQLPIGLYIARISTQEGVISKKFEIVR